MEKIKTIGQVYAYLVCLASIVITIVCVGFIVRSIFNYVSPLNSNDYYSNYNHNYQSLDTYKASLINYVDNTNKTNPMSDEETQKAFTDEKAGFIDKVKFDAIKTITVDSLLVVLSAILFLTHWRLAKKNQQI